jgi:hypothetical protein
MDKTTPRAADDAERLIKDLVKTHSHLRKALRLNDKSESDLKPRLESQLCLINQDKTGDLALTLITRINENIMEKALSINLSPEYGSLKVESPTLYEYCFIAARSTSWSTPPILPFFIYSRTPENAQIALKITEKIEQTLAKERRG